MKKLNFIVKINMNVTKNKLIEALKYWGNFLNHHFAKQLKSKIFSYFFVIFFIVLNKKAGGKLYGKTK